ncbi:F-box protein SKIP23-like [Vicia villosa]|uniref:F-box protein SKIP23-like n=1 Tax=Vicia villosa TaxID=3911 RepID=UPI00273A93EA|nr:F-box protein SKIP23-like [Vicia villosa]
MADWSQLPKDLLQLISEKLNSDFYILRFRSVCSTWRLSIPKPHNYFPLELPHFSKYGKLYKHSIFLIKPPATPNQQTLYRPWLLRISPTSSGKVNFLHPFLLDTPIQFSLLNFNQLSVYELGHIYIHGILYPNSSTVKYRPYDRYVATFQGEQLLDIVTLDIYSGEVAMFCCGDNRWTKLSSVATFYQDICIFKGRPCVTDRTGRTLMIRSDLSVHLVVESVFGADDCGVVYIMVENESELLLVHKYKDYPDGNYNHYDDDELLRFDVFRLDQREKKWLKLENLGDMVLFLGQGYSFAISASDLGFENGNSVIYCNHICSEMRVFPLDQQRTFPLSDYPDYVKLFWPPPEWIASRCL